ncbi:MAG: hypothetical protein M5R41_06620 [Bacteroidia bacterium]|nr:hypothetical protein [Bacteroidia bacterium]
MSKQKPSNVPPAPSPVREASFTLAWPFLLLALLRIGAAFIPHERVWGLHALAYLPLWTTVLFAALGIFAATPMFYSAFLAAAKSMRADAPPVTRALWLLLPVVGGGALFWFLRMETFFLGDGAVYLAEIFRYMNGATFAEDVLYSNGSAPLTGRLMALFATVAHRFVSESGQSTVYSQSAFWISGVLAGMLYVGVSVAAARALFRAAEARFALLFLFLFTPAVLFFFGYVEYYTLVFTAGLAYFSTLALAMRGRIGILWPVALFVLMSALHLMALLALPSLLLLIVHRYGGEGGRRLLTPRNIAVLLGVFFAAGIALYLLSGAAFEGSRVLLALTDFGQEGAVQRYTLLSSWHLIDVLNEVLLLGGPVLLLLPAICWRDRLRDAEVLIATVNLALFSALLFAGYTCFGMARDWDVNALWSLTLIFTVVAGFRDTRVAELRYRFYLASGAAFAAVLPWLAVNLTTDSAVARFRDVMALDDRHVTGDFALNGYEHLRKHYRTIEDTDGVLWAVEKKIDMVGYRSDYSAYLSTVMQLTDPARVRRGFDFATGRLRAALQDMNDRGVDTVYAGHKQDFLERYYEIILEGHHRVGSSGFTSAWTRDHLDWLRPRVAGDPLFIMLEHLVLQGTEQIPLSMIVAGARTLYQSPTIAIGLASQLVVGGENEMAIDVLQRSFTRNPETVLLAFYLAETELKLQPPRVGDARRHLRALLAFPDGLLTGTEEEQRQILQWAERKLKELDKTDR